MCVCVCVCVCVCGCVEEVGACEGQRCKLTTTEGQRQPCFCLRSALRISWFYLSVLVFVFLGRAFRDACLCAFHRQTCSSAFLGHLCVLFTNRHVHLLFWDTFVCFSRTGMFILFISFSGTPLCAFLGIVTWDFLQTWWCVFLVHIYKHLLATVFNRCLDVKHHVCLRFSADAGGDGRHGFGVTAQGGQHCHHHRREGTAVGTAA